MRSDQEILQVLTERARNDERIRAVLLSGSRADPRATKDPFQDFDIVYFVTAIQPFTDDHRWIDEFGERMIFQMPEAMRHPPPLRNERFPYLIQFMDGHRIDLTLVLVADAKDYDDGPSEILLDKDGLLAWRRPLDPSRHYAPPSDRLFSDCCNEFWWMCLNVAKGLWRAEIPYAKYMFDQVHRDQLMTMMVWSIPTGPDPGCNTGKFGKHLERCLEPELWKLLLSTYADADIDRTWRSLDAMCALFRITAMRVAKHYDFVYPTEEDEKVTARLGYIRSLPKGTAAKGEIPC